MTTLTPLARTAAVASLLAGAALAQAAQPAGGTIGSVISSPGNGAGEPRTAAPPARDDGAAHTGAARAASAAASTGKRR